MQNGDYSVESNECSLLAKSYCVCMHRVCIMMCSNKVQDHQHNKFASLSYNSFFFQRGYLDTRSTTAFHLHLNPLHFLKRISTIQQFSKIFTSPKRHFFQHVIYTDCM